MRDAMRAETGLETLGLGIRLTFLLLVMGACSQAVPMTGWLEGRVTIGPLVPVLREGESPPTPSPDVFGAREIVVFKPNGTTEVMRIPLDDVGRFRGELPVGAYIVDINHIGIDFADGYPKEVEIHEGEITRLEVDIDTGIR
jgi:hypothetical protein